MTFEEARAMAATLNRTTTLAFAPNTTTTAREIKLIAAVVEAIEFAEHMRLVFGSPSLSNNFDDSWFRNHLEVLQKALPQSPEEAKSGVLSDLRNGLEA